MNISSKKHRIKQHHNSNSNSNSKRNSNNNRNISIKNTITDRRIGQHHYNSKIKQKKHSSDGAHIGVIGNKIKKIAEEYYPPSMMTIYINEHIRKPVNNMKLNITIQVWIWSGKGTPTDPGIVCLKLDFDYTNKLLFIEEINKCKFNGRKNLTNAIEIANKLQYNTIMLADESKIKGKFCSFSLKIYKILLNGQSWYNKYGFKGQYHDTEQLEISKIRKKSFSTVIDNFCEEKTNTDFKNIWMSLQYIQSIYKINIKNNTQNVFKQLEIIRKTLKIENDKNMFICILSPIIELFKNNINYDSYLLIGDPRHYI
jgi:hypothetical protein